MNLTEQVKAKIAANPAGESLLWASWNRVCDQINAHALAMRPKPKSFEVHHMTEVARKNLLQAYVEDKPMPVCEAHSLNSIGIV